jgi:hypothetical protein
MKRSLGLLVLFLGLTALTAEAGWQTYGHHGGHHYRGPRYHRPYYPPYRYYPGIRVGVGYYGYPYFWGAPYYWGHAYPRAYHYPEPVRLAGRYVPRGGAVETDVRPKKAQVALDGQVIGQARDFNGPWDVLVLPRGEHTLEFSAPGHMTLLLKLDVKPGAYYHLTQELLKGEGLDPRSSPEPPPAAAAAPAPVPPPARSPRAAPPPSEAAPPPEEPALRRGLLHIRVEPGDAAVYLDGEFLARADELARLHGAIPVARGEHVLEVIRPGYVGVSRTVQVVGEEPTRVRIELVREE